VKIHQIMIGQIHDLSKKLIPRIFFLTEFMIRGMIFLTKNLPFIEWLFYQIIPDFQAGVFIANLNQPC